MENKTKILAFAAVALMFAVCFIGFVAINDGEVDAESTTTNVAKIGETPYPTLIDAIKNVKNGETITLVRDVTDGSGVGIFVNGDGYIVYNATTHAKEDMALKKGEKLTLDLNGKTYCVTTPAVGSEGYETQAFHLEMGFNVTIKNGTITSSGSSVKMLVQNYCNLTLDNVTLDGSNLPGAKRYVLSNNFGNITITGNTQIIAPSNGVAFDLWYGMSSSYDNGVFVTFDEKFTGIVNGTIEYGADADRVTNGNLTNKAVLKINGSGTFKGDLKFSSNQITVADIKISSGSFTDIANAVKYATSGATITLAENVTLSSSIVVTKSVTIDLNGKAITSSTRVFKILANDVIFTINANGGSISTTDTVVFTYNGYANPNVIVNGGTYSGNYVFVNYAQCGSFSIDNAVVNGKSAGIWFGSGPTSEASITDSTIVATGMGIYLGTVKKATLSNVKVTGGTGIEIKSGDVVINGDSIIKATADYKEDLDMNNNGSGGSVAAICINNAYVHITKGKHPEMTYVSVSIADSVKIESKSNDQKMICITSGYEHGTTKSIENTPIYVNSDLNIEKIGILCKGTADSPVKSPIIYNGVAYAFNQDMYDVVKSDSNVNGYDISLAEGVELTVGTVNGTVTLAKGAKLTIAKDSTFTGTINGPSNNKLVANGMKAGKGGITITGGSLIINGDIISESGSVAGATVTVTGDGIKISGSLDTNVTMVIEKDTIVTVKSGDEFSFNGTITNNGTLRIENSTTITTVDASKVVNNGVVVDERAKDARAVPVTNDGTVVAKNNADMYKGEGVDVVEQDPDKPVATEGKIEVNTNKYAFITPIMTTGKLDIVMNDGYKQYTVTIPEGTAIAAGTVISVSFIEYQSDSVTRYQINTPGIENFSMKLPCQIGFKKAKVYCDDSELGVSKVRYDAGTGYVTFDASHNSVFTIVLSNTSHAGTTTVSGGDAANDYSLVIAITVLVASLGFLAYVIKKR